MLDDIRNKEWKAQIEQKLNVVAFDNDPFNLPENEEELSLHMQLDYKQSIEIAEEEAINNVMDLNDYDLIKRRLDYDITVLGIAAVKNEFNTSEGIRIKYVDPIDIVHSYTDSPYFEDLYYVGEVRKLSIPELKKQFPELTDEDIKDIENSGAVSELYKNFQIGRAHV